MAIRKAFTDFSERKDFTVTVIIEKDVDKYIILDELIGDTNSKEFLDIMKKYKILISSAFGVPKVFWA